jgi:hypothetical protein
MNGSFQNLSLDWFGQPSTQAQTLTSRLTRAMPGMAMGRGPQWQGSMMQQQSLLIIACHFIAIQHEQVFSHSESE